MEPLTIEAQCRTAMRAIEPVATPAILSKTTAPKLHDTILQLENVIQSQVKLRAPDRAQAVLARANKYLDLARHELAGRQAHQLADILNENSWQPCEMDEDAEDNGLVMMCAHVTPAIPPDDLQASPVTLGTYVLGDWELYADDTGSYSVINTL